MIQNYVFRYIYIYIFATTDDIASFDSFKNTNFQNLSQERLGHEIIYL